MSDNYPVDGELRRQAERIEALEQAHAELAETVDQMISKAGTDCDKCEGRGWRINVPSQTMYPCTWCSGKGKVNIAAPAPDPVCLDCGHPKSDHTPNGIVCQRDQSNPEGPHCHCHGYIDPGWKPRMEPAPLDNDEGMHTLPAKTAAQERYHEANERHYSNREVEMAAGAFDRAEEVAQELDDWTHLIHMRLNTLSQSISLLDPAPVFTDEQDSAIRHALSHLREAGNDRETRGLSTDRIDQSCNVLVAMLGRDGAR